MGRRIEKTLDMGLDKEFQVEISPRCGMAIGKVHGLGARENQEDAFGISETEETVCQERGIFLILADGMGGLCDGEKASAAAVIAGLNYFEEYELGLRTQEQFFDLVSEANERVRDALGSAAGVGGSTLVAAWIKERKVYWVSVGDSRLYLFREGALIQLNHEHTHGAALDRMAQEGEITLQEAKNSPNRKALTSYIGMREVEEVDMNEEALELQKGDRLLLMSDGVFGTLTKEEMERSMEYTAEKAAKHIKMQIEKRKKRNQDNYTAVIVEII